MAKGKPTKAGTKKKAAPKLNSKGHYAFTAISSKKGGGSLDPGPNKPKK